MHNLIKARRNTLTAALTAALTLGVVGTTNAQEAQEDCFDCNTVHSIDPSLAIAALEETSTIDAVQIIGATPNGNVSEPELLIGETRFLPKIDLADHRMYGWTDQATYRISGIYAVTAEQAGDHTFEFSAQDFYGIATCQIIARTADHEVARMTLSNIGSDKISRPMSLSFKEGAYPLSFDMACGQDATVSMDIRVVAPGTNERHPPDLRRFASDDAVQVYTAWAPDDLAQIKSVQTGLNALGFGAGPADGLIGRLTRNAIASFAKATDTEQQVVSHSNIIKKIEQARRNELYVSYDTEAVFIGRPFSNKIRQRLANHSLSPVKETFDRLMAVADAAPGTNLSWSVNSQTYGHITLLDTFKDCIFAEQSITLRDFSESGRYYVCRDLSERWTLAKQKPSALGPATSGS